MADTHLPPPQPLGRNEPRTSPIGVERRIERQARRARDRWRGWIVRRIVRERRLGELLDRELGPVAVVLHGRSVAGASAIDHLVVATSGVWVVEARHESGRVEGRRRARRHGVVRLRTGRHEYLELSPQRTGTAAVEEHLERMGFEWLDVHRVVCLTNADWGVFRRPFELDGTLFTWGRALLDTIGVPGPLGPGDMRAVAVELGGRLPIAR